MPKPSRPNEPTGTPTPALQSQVALPWIAYKDAMAQIAEKAVGVARNEAAVDPGAAAELQHARLARAASAQKKR